LDQEVHRERSGQTVFIILVSERQVDHGAIVGGALSCRSDFFFQISVVVELVVQQFVGFW
jgi:hypothetical protein